jgi:hypothetical protein
VPARDDQRDRRPVRSAIGEEARIQMRFEVVHAEERNLENRGQNLRLGDAH